MEAANHQVRHPCRIVEVAAAQRSSSLQLPAQRKASLVPHQRALVVHMPGTFGLTSAAVAGGQAGLGTLMTLQVCSLRGHAIGLSIRF